MKQVGPELEGRLVVAIPQPRGFVIGVDVGATRIAAGLVDDHGKILGQTRLAMVPNGTACAGLNAVVSVPAPVCGWFGSAPPDPSRKEIRPEPAWR